MDVRWEQRFANFARAYALLSEALEHGADALSMLEKEGAIQRFEFTFELAWKTLKDFLEAGGLTIAPVTPRNVIKQAFAAKVVSDGQVWIDMLDHRNLLSRTYDESVFERVLAAVDKRYLSVLGALRDALQAQVKT